ncbi:hypothetical protein CHS0354_000285 [Potamilus streckersoni]|uniref:G-protein coupled receptors family 3 profile domain-containing protein n=1 Tax=Potamilus streckersoni TaxID=2493646 RepID=A0AAE0RYM5_9BIVA|nr:hypothetical protein CHS0354_000285 [Potamilus streckersoni]
MIINMQTLRALSVLFIVNIQLVHTLNYKYLNLTGDLIIGGLLPMHHLKEGGGCSETIVENDGIQALEGMLYAIRKINSEVLPGFKLGLVVMDTCFSDTVALDRTMKFIMQKIKMQQGSNFWTCPNGSEPVAIADENYVVGVIGATSSAESIQVASLLRLFKIPQISYRSTTPELSDKGRYDYFKRTVPSDIYQSKAIVGLLRLLNWTYITGVFEDSSYGEQGFQLVMKAASQNDICVAYSRKMKRYFSSEEEKKKEMNDIVDALNAHNNTNGKIVVVLYAYLDLVEVLFQTIYERGYSGRYIWVGSDAWAAREFTKAGVQMVADGAIALLPLAKEMPDFDKYFTSLTPDNNKDNSWFKEYWEQVFNCSLSAKDCTQHSLAQPKVQIFRRGSSRRGNGTRAYQPDLNIYFVMDAVLAYAHALKEIHSVECPGVNGLCDRMKQNVSQQNFGTRVLTELEKVEFTNFIGLKFKFINGSEGQSRYSIMQYNKMGTPQWKPIGTFDENSSFVLDENFISMTKESICSAPCKVGEALITSRTDKCCWECNPCGEAEYLSTISVCKRCSDGTRPDSNRTGCISTEETYMSHENKYAIVFCVLSTSAIIVTICVGVIYYRKRETPIIKATGTEMSFVILSGVIFSYASSFIFVAYPSPASCGGTRLILGLSYSLVYAAILVKTNRIYRVFNIKGNQPKKLAMISTQSQLLIMAGVVVVEVIILVMWIIFKPPDVTNIYPDNFSNILVCKDSTDFSYLGALVYPFILMIICMVYGFLTRKAPDGFNEARHIAFGSYAFCVMWLAFVPIYFSIQNNTVRIACLCLASFINATVTLLTLFFQKVYVVLCHPEKNTRESVMTRKRMFTIDTSDLDKLSALSKIRGYSVSTFNSFAQTRKNSKRSSSEQHLSTKDLSISTISHDGRKERPNSFPEISSSPAVMLELSDFANRNSLDIPARGSCRERKNTVKVKDGTFIRNGSVKAFATTSFYPICLEIPSENENNEVKKKNPAIVVTPTDEVEDTGY